MLALTMDIEKFADLLKIGLTEGEAKVYAALLELGPSTVGPVTKRAGVSSSNIYEILERLLEKGIVTVIVKNGIKNFQPVNPVNLVHYIDKKQKELDLERQQLKKALPRIKALKNAFPEQTAQLFIGTRGLAAAYKEFYADISPDKENLWIYVHDPRFEKISDKFYLHTWFDLAKKVQSKGISDTAYRRTRFIREFKKKYPMRFVDFPIFSHGEVYGDNFLLVSWEDTIITVLVTAKHVSENFRTYWYSVWKVAKK
jgi:HTH-type transcriptional regulator, sugar sensing transcriptional regulator